RARAATAGRWPRAPRRRPRHRSPQSSKASVAAVHSSCSGVRCYATPLVRATTRGLESLRGHEACIAAGMAHSIAQLIDQAAALGLAALLAGCAVPPSQPDSPTPSAPAAPEP